MPESLLGPYLRSHGVYLMDATMDGIEITLHALIQTLFIQMLLREPDGTVPTNPEKRWFLRVKRASQNVSRIHRSAPQLSWLASRVMHRRTFN